MDNFALFLHLPWWVFFGALILGAVLTLDVTGFAQTWFSQPLPAGILAGILAGDLQTGLLIGVPIQMLSIANLPVGRSCSGERTSFVIAAVILMAPLNNFELIVFVSTKAMMSHYGWLVVIACVGSYFGGSIIRLERSVHFKIMINGTRKSRVGAIKPLIESHKKCMVITATRGALLVLFWMFALSVFLIPLYEKLPELIISVISVVPYIAVTVGIISLFELYGSRKGWLWMNASLVGTVVVLLLMQRGG